MIMIDVQIERVNAVTLLQENIDSRVLQGESDPSVYLVIRRGSFVKEYRFSNPHSLNTKIFIIQFFAQY